MATLFVSHSSRDGAAIAQLLAAALEAAGHRCWIAPRDVKPGMPYPGQIVAAIRDCDGLVLIVTPAANDSPDVLQEVQLAGQHRKTVAPVIVNSTTPSDDLHYYLGVRHQIPWSDAQKTTAELLRAFPSASASPPQGKSFNDAVRDFAAPAWAPSMPQTEPAPNSSDRFDVFMATVGPNKINIIKVIREYTGWGLAEAKTSVEGVPPYKVGSYMTGAHAQALVTDLAAQGATMLPLAPRKP